MNFHHSEHWSSFCVSSLRLSAGQTGFEGLVEFFIVCTLGKKDTGSPANMEGGEYIQNTLTHSQSGTKWFSNAIFVYSEERGRKNSGISDANPTSAKMKGPSKQ